MIIPPMVKPEKNSPTGKLDSGRGPAEYKIPTAKQNIPINNSGHPVRTTNTSPKTVAIPAIPSNIHKTSLGDKFSRPIILVFCLYSSLSRAL